MRNFRVGLSFFLGISTMGSAASQAKNPFPGYPAKGGFICTGDDPVAESVKYRLQFTVSKDMQASLRRYCIEGTNCIPEVLEDSEELGKVTGYFDAKGNEIYSGEGFAFFFPGGRNGAGEKVYVGAAGKDAWQVQRFSRIVLNECRLLENQSLHGEGKRERKDLANATQKLLPMHVKTTLDVIGGESFLPKAGILISLSSEALYLSHGHA